MRTIVWRTYLIADEEAMAAVDWALADRVTGWGVLSVAKTEAAIDALVDEFDPAALRRSRESASSRTVEFGSPSDVAGTTSMWARLYAADAAVIEQRVEEMARSVCANDPRTLAERPADALTALGAGTDLACACGDADCATGDCATKAANNAVVYVVADEKSVDAATAAAAPSEPASSAPQCPAPPAYVCGGGVLPTALLGATPQRATIREVRHPGDTPPDPRYTPTRATAEFVRCRDLTCRFPGCDKPAQVCDLDHTVPYPVGPTHPSNLKCLCRFHRMHKTYATANSRHSPGTPLSW